MRFAMIKDGEKTGLALSNGAEALALLGDDSPGDLDALIAPGGDALAAAAKTLKEKGRSVDPAGLSFLPPLSRSPKIICLGINYSEHAAEMGGKPTTFPTIFARFATSFVAHGQPIVRPRVSEQLDYEGELVAVIGKGGKNIDRANALDHIAGYSIFNDGSIRDYQRLTTQFMPGKNFDSTGGFGPWLVTADEVPPGAAGLALETRLNGQTVQKSSTSLMIFDVAETVHVLSSFMTLLPGDMLVTGTPSGVGAARKPPLWMKHGDVVEVEIEGLGVLRNPIVDE